MPKKKIKILKKKKVKEIKKKGTKIREIKKNVKIKEIKKRGSELKTNIEDSGEEINDEKFSQILQPSKSPVLEQIAVSGGSNLEQITPIRKKDEELLDVSSDYTQLGTLKDEKDKYQSSSSDYDSMTNLDKDERERRRNLSLMRQDKKGESSFELENESKKYVNKGDYR